MDFLVKKSKNEERLKPENLDDLAKERLGDALALFDAKRYRGAFYLCGYAVETALKKKICTTLGWDEYPSGGKDSNKYSSFKTHDLEVLLHLSGAEKRIAITEEWSIIMKWNVEIRYSLDNQSPEDVKLMIDASKSLVEKL